MLNENKKCCVTSQIPLKSEEVRKYLFNKKAWKELSSSCIINVDIKESLRPIVKAQLMERDTILYSHQLTIVKRNAMELLCV